MVKNRLSQRAMRVEPGIVPFGRRYLTATASVRIEASLAHIELRSITPNLKAYQMKELPDGDWKDVSNPVEVELKKDESQIVFRTVNLADVTGPEHRVVIGNR